MISYAQNFEDVILERLFAEQRYGFYIDIGASHPTNLSVTKHFYDRGWRGINVEPIRRNWEIFQKERPRDINLNVAVGMDFGSIEFCEVCENDALSSFDKNRISLIQSAGIVTNLYSVDCVTGDSIFEQGSPQVDFLKIDVEGAEKDVIFSIDLSKYRPKVLVIEATSQMDQFPGWEHFSVKTYENWDGWEPYVIQSGYVFIHFDGLNRFYIRDDLTHLAERLVLPPGVFDFIIPDIEKLLNSEREKAEFAFREALHKIEEECNLLKLENQENLILIKHAELLNVELAKALKAYRLAFYPINLFRPIYTVLAWISRRCLEIVRPRLGNLNQYQPRPIVAFDSNDCTIQLTATPKISIVTPSFQQGDFIERTIRSVLEQSYPNLDYYIQDGGSKDNTVNVLKRYETQIMGWISENDSGQSQAINLGFSKTTGEIMAWLNSDDLIFPGTLFTVADYFNNHPDVDVVYGDRLLIDENDMEIGRWIMPGHDSDVLSWVDFIPQETLFWRRRIWDKAGGQVDESFRFAMDWDLLVRFRDAGATFAHIPQFLGAFRIHDHQKTSASINEIGHQEMDRIRQRVQGRIPNSKEIRKAILPFLFKHVMVDMIYRIKTRLSIKR